MTAISIQCGGPIRLYRGAIYNVSGRIVAVTLARYASSSGARRAAAKLLNEVTTCCN